MNLHAQLENGLYRVKNFKTERYVYVLDNTGSINYSTTSADMGAMELWKDLDRCVDHPGSIIQVVNVAENKYNLKSQGTSVWDIIQHNVMIYPSTGGTYQIYASQGSLGKYLSDEETTDVPDGQMGTTNKGDYRKWVAVPMDNEENYFGVRPILTNGEKYYKTFYADFRFSLLGEGMKAYKVTEVYKHIACIEEITDGVIPAQAPVMLECGSSNCADNKLALSVRDNQSLQGTNLLKGVFFNNPYRPRSKDARTANDPATMRVLGLTKEGKIGFVTSTESYIEANSAYLSVPEGTPAELILMSREELDAYKTTDGIMDIEQKTADKAIYNLSGIKVADSLNELQQLPAGVYVVNGKKVIR